MNSAIQFVKEAYYELLKASWLTRQQALESTRVVIVIVLLVSVYVASVDFVLSVIFGAIMGR